MKEQALASTYLPRWNESAGQDTSVNDADDVTQAHKRNESGNGRLFRDYGHIDLQTESPNGPENMIDHGHRRLAL